MKINKVSHYSKKKLLLIVGLILIALGVGAIVFKDNLHKSVAPNKGVNSVDYSNTTSDQKKSGDQIKLNSQDTSNKSNSTKSDQPIAPTPIPGSNKSDVQISITAANQTNSTFQVRALIGAVVSNGTCTLTFQRLNSTTITKTSDVQPLANTSTCKGFDIPLSELTTGVWHMTISYIDASLTGTAEEDITIK